MVVIIIIIIMIIIIIIMNILFLDIHQRGVQSEGGAVDGCSII